MLFCAKNLNTPILNITEQYEPASTVSLEKRDELVEIKMIQTKSTGEPIGSHCNSVCLWAMDVKDLILLVFSTTFFRNTMSSY